jgi:hypothetical protein
MARSAHIRVERVAFIAALKVILKSFEDYKVKADAAEAKYTAACEAWALDILAKGKYDKVEAHHRGVFLSVTDKVGNTRPKRPEIEEPKNYNRYTAINDLRSTLTLLEMSTDDTVSTYTYADVARYL